MSRRSRTPKRLHRKLDGLPRSDGVRRSEQCNKLVFSTKKKAINYCLQQHDKDAGFFPRPYKCRGCSQWHVTTQK